LIAATLKKYAVPFLRDVAVQVNSGDKPVVAEAQVPEAFA